MVEGQGQVGGKGTKCSAEDCTRSAEKRGYCNTHYRKMLRHGDPHLRLKRVNGTGSIYLNREGYLVVQLGRHSEKLHRLIAEHFLGRGLLPGEIVHHKDGDKLNNHPANLEITNRAEHCTRHHKGVYDQPLNTETHKLCPRCRCVKPRGDFCKDNHNTDGLRAHCRPCCAEMGHLAYVKRIARRRSAAGGQGDEAAGPDHE